MTTAPDAFHHDIADRHDKVLIVDFGSQVTQLIARRVREAGVYCEIAPFQNAERAFADIRPKAVILSGGPCSVTEKDSPRAPQSIFESGVPVLGICYGEQTMATQLGGTVEGGHHREFGRAEVTALEQSALFDGVWEKGGSFPVWMSHGDRVTKLPDGFRVIAASENAPLAAIADEARRYYGVQFHLEVVHTPDGAKLLSNFVHKVAGLKSDWTMAAFRGEAIAAIRRQVGDGRVLCGLSGGVDSAVAAVLIHEAIGERLTCVFVDHGLLRQGEAEEVVRLFRDHYNIPLHHVEAEELFLGALEGVDDPETKRKTIGRLVHRDLRGRGEEDRAGRARRAAVSRARHALSGCDRERVVYRRAVGDDQIASQCRRPAGAHEHAARRALARTLQGRGARLGPRTRTAGSVRRAPSLSGARARDPLPGHRHAREAGDPAQGRRRLSRRNPQGRIV